MKRLYSWMMLAIFMLCLSSCGDDEESTPAAPATIEIAVSQTNDHSISFVITTENAAKAAWICQPANDASPNTEQILAQGIEVKGSPAHFAADNLKPDTEYKIYAAAINADGLAVSKEVSARTDEFVPAPSIQIATYGQTDTSLSFFVTVKNAEQCSWLCLPAAEEAPAAERVLQGGTALDLSTETILVEVTGLAPATDYVFYAAASNVKGVSIIEEKESRTNEPEKLPSDYEFVITGCKDMAMGNGYHIMKFNDAGWSFETSIDIYANPASELIPAGTYPLGSGTIPPVMNMESSTIDIYNPYGSHHLTAGELVVEINEGIYTIELSATLDNGKTFHGIFEGLPELQ